MLGYSQDELRKLTFQNITHANDLSRDMSNLHMLLSGKISTYHMEKRYIKKDKSILWAILTVAIVKDRSDNPEYFISVINDISEKKSLEIEHQVLYEQEIAQRREIEKHLNLIDKYIITSSTDLKGKITATSEAFCKISGYEQSELIGQHHNIVRHEDMPTSIYSDMWSSLQNNNTWQGELKNKTKNGDYYGVDATISPLFNAQNEKIGYTAIRHIITSKKDLEESQEIIVSQSRLSAMGEILSVVSHHWRQPLTILSVGLQKLRLMIELDQDKSDLDKKFNDLDVNLQALSNTINDFQRFLDPKSSNELISIDEIITSSIYVNNMNFEKNEISIDYNIETSISELILSSQLKQVILNILKNSLESLLQSDITDKKIAIDVLKFQNSINITIDDNGIGISNENINKVFEPYFSTKDELNGKGLGLYVSKIIVENTLNGTIQIANCNEGVRINIIIPYD
jgi:PAS domain S-box-containing protein